MNEELEQAFDQLGTAILEHLDAIESAMKTLGWAMQQTLERLNVILGEWEGFVEEQYNKAGAPNGPGPEAAWKWLADQRATDATTQPIVSEGTMSPASHHMEN